MTSRASHFCIVTVALGMLSCVVSAQTATDTGQLGIERPSPQQAQSLLSRCRETVRKEGGAIILAYRSDVIAEYNGNKHLIRHIPINELPKPCTPESIIIRLQGYNGYVDNFIEILSGSRIVRLSVNDVVIYPRIKFLDPGIFSFMSGALAMVLYRNASPDVPMLPWPPPQATWTGEVTTQIATSRKLGEIESQIRQHFVSRGYDTLHYFSVPGGFAITTPAERFLDDGTVGPNRWVIDRVGGWDGFKDYLQQLVNGEQTQFRVFMIVVTSEDFGTAGYKATQSDIERWNSAGRPSLSRQLSDMPVIHGTRVWLMVHEFHASQSKGIRMEASAGSTTNFLMHRRALGFK